jgi:hypothetical protein
MKSAPTGKLALWQSVVLSHPLGREGNRDRPSLRTFAPTMRMPKTSYAGGECINDEVAEAGVVARHGSCATSISTSEDDQREREP